MPIIKADKEKKLTGLGMLVRHEGFELDPYEDLENKGMLIGGVGHQMSDEEIREFNYDWSDKNKENYWIGKLKEDYKKAGVSTIRQSERMGFTLTPKQQDVLTNMSFQMGEYALTKSWPKFMNALKKKNYEEASKQMLISSKGGPSKWSIQSPNRAKELAEIIRSGE